MEILLIFLILLFGIGILSILFVNKENFKKYLAELEVLGVLVLIILIIYIQSVILDKEYAVNWSYEKTDKNTFLYKFSIPNVNNISIKNITILGGKIKIYLYYCYGDKDIEFSIYLPEVYKSNPKELILDQEIC